MKTRSLLLPNNRWDAIQTVLYAYIIIWASPWWIVPMVVSNLLGYFDARQCLSDR